MSGFEIAGVVLGAFPLIISGLEHWRDVAKVAGFYWRIRKEYSKCRSDILYHEILYKRNLKELLLPLLDEPDDVARLISEPGGEEWKSETMQERLRQRLKESYSLYMDIILELEVTAQAFKKELSIEDPKVQSNLDPPQSRSQQQSASPQPLNTQSKLASAKAKWDYEKFRLKFSFNEAIRVELVRQLEKCNQRLKELLRTSDTLAALNNVTSRDKKQQAGLERVFKKSRKRSKLLFMAIQRSWHCTCQPDHYIHLRLEHRTQAEAYFEIILTSIASSSNTSASWSWKELRCGDMAGCSTSHDPNVYSNITGSARLPALSGSQTTATPRKVAFVQSFPSPPVSLASTDHDVKLCQALGKETCSDCMGIIHEDDECYHLHKSKKRKRPSSGGVLTLDKLIADRTLTRHQRYLIGLLLASSVAQLQETPWLTTGLKKEHVVFYPCEDDDCVFPYREPFIRQRFSQTDSSGPNTDGDDCNFYSLGILLLELCFAQRLEDHPYRKKYPVGTADIKEAFDLMAALRWSHDVPAEGGHEYASAVKWCFMTGRDQTQAWQSAIIQNVIRPLEICQEHFEVVAFSQ